MPINWHIFRILLMGTKNEIFSKILKKFQELYPHGKRNLILDQIVHFILSQDENIENAHAARQSLMADFVDWNEIRISHLREIQACLAKHLKNPADKAHRLKDMLSQIFNLYNRMDLEFLWERDLIELQKMATLVSCLTEDFLNSLIASGFYEPDGSISPQFVRYGKRLGLWEENINPTILKKALTKELKDIGPEGLAKVYAALNFHDTHPIHTKTTTANKELPKSALDTIKSNLDDSKLIEISVDDILDDDELESASPIHDIRLQQDITISERNSTLSPTNLNEDILSDTTIASTISKKSLDSIISSLHNNQPLLQNPQQQIISPQNPSSSENTSQPIPIQTISAPILETEQANLQNTNTQTDEETNQTPQKTDSLVQESKKIQPAVSEKRKYNKSSSKNATKDTPVPKRKVGRPKKNPDIKVKQNKTKTKKISNIHKKTGPKPGTKRGKYKKSKKKS